MRFDSKLKVYVAVFATTVISVLLSVFFTGILRGGLTEISTLVPSIVVPLCVAPPLSLWGYSQAYKIQELNKKLVYLLNHDPLTDVHSRSYFFEVANNYSQSGSAVTLMIDADYFKQINDRYGHHIGDDALIHFSAQITRHCRKTDVVARLGGEEFGVFMPNTDIKTALVVAERIRQQIARNALTLEHEKISLSASIGVASGGPSEKIDDVLRRADKALYRAKAKGRNQVCLEMPIDTNAPANQLRDLSA